jgi:hypothetical protein
MSYEELALDIFFVVRTKYREGSFESDNKTYTKEAMQSLVDAGVSKPGRLYRFRNNNNIANIKTKQGAAVGQRYAASTDPSDADAVIGGIIFKIPQPALNCAELTQMACHLANKKTKDYCAVHLTPTDHAFCVIGCQGSFLDKITVPIREFSGQSWTNVFAVDVWLNICCPLTKYGASAEKKLEKWTAAGKRIAWVAPGEDEDSWAVPTGDYSKQFLDSKLNKGL